MKFINQLTLPRKSADDIVKNIKSLSIKQVEHILQPIKPRANASNLCEYLQGVDLSVKLYFDSDQYYANKPDDTECQRILTAFKNNIADFMQEQEAFDIQNVRYAARHGLTSKKDKPHKISFRAFVVDWITPYSRMKDLIEIRGLQGDDTGRFDTKVYTPNEQLINCVFACKGGPKAKYDSRVLLPFGKLAPVSDYIIQYLKGDEKMLDITKFVKNDPPQPTIPQQVSAVQSVQALRKNKSAIFSKNLENKSIDNKIVDMLNMLKQARWDERDSWINLAIILKRHGSGDLYYPVWLKLSQTSRKFDSEADARKQWDSLRLDFDKKPIGIGSLRKWASEDDPNGYHRLVADDKDRRWLKGDLGLSEMAADLCSNIIKFDPDQKVWFYFKSDICKWRQVSDSTAKKTIGDALRACMCTIRSEISSQASQAADSDERNRFEGLLDKIGNIIKYVQDNRGLRNILGVGLDQFSQKNFLQKLDTVKYLIGVKNGLVDLRTGVLRQATPEDMICRDLDVDYDENSDTSFIETFIRDIMADDEIMVDYIRKLLGYSITGETNEEIFVFLTASGRNGKSLLINLMEELMRDTGYFVQGNTGLIVNRRVSNIDAERAKLNGSRLVVFNELKPDELLSLDDFKVLSGSDPINAAAKYGAPFSILPTHLPICITNSMPKLPIVDIATAERCVVIEFPVCYVELVPGEPSSQFRRQRDNGLKQKLSEHKAGLLNFCVKGAIDWYVNGGLRRDAPEKVKAFTKEYLSEQNDIERFLQSYCTIGDTLRMPTTALLEAFNFHMGTSIQAEEIASKMLTKGFKKKVAKILGTKKSAMCFIGVDLKKDDASKA